MKPYDLGLYEKSMPNSLSLPEKLREAKNAGFDYLELSIDESDEKLARLSWNEKELQALWLAQRQAGLPIRSICLSGHRRFPMGDPDPGVRQRSQELLRGAVDLAGALGVRLIQLAGYDVYYQSSTAETMEYFSRGLRQAVDYAAERGVLLGFETMETDFMNTVEKAMRWVEQLNSPYLQVYPDVGNLTNAALTCGHSLCGDLGKGAGHLAAVHLKESRPGVFREVPFGQGHVDFPLVAGCAAQLGVRMFVGEFWYVGQENWRDDLRGSCDFLRQALNTAFSA